MNMGEIPTPETDAAYKQWLLESDKSHRIRMGQTMESLERRLTITRAALDKLARLGNEPNYGYSDGNIIAHRALTKTAPKQCT